MYDWEEKYAIGHESIDNAHREMFRVMSRVNRIVTHGGNLQWAVVESVKFFKSYASKHFADEEEFMRQVGYVNFEAHKAVHEGMKNKILPRIHSELEHSKYSEAAIHKYLGLCHKWLQRHILTQDRELIKWVEIDTE